MRRNKFNKEKITGIIFFIKIIWVVAVGVASIAAAIYAYDGLFYSRKGLELQTSLIQKELLPFFKYSYSESQQSFLIETEEDVSIHSTQWFFPYTDKTFYSIPKNSNSITIDEILSVIWLAANERKTLIPSPDFQTNSYGYFRCEILASFDEYNSGVEKDAGFPMAVLIEYTRKGENVKKIFDLILIREFEDSTPQIRSIKSSATENELKSYMKKGTERLGGILNSNKYDGNQKYIDDNGKCTRFVKAFKQYFFNKKDEEEFNNEMKKLLGE